jgi:hypothetical protein
MWRSESNAWLSILSTGSCKTRTSLELVILPSSVAIWLVKLCRLVREWWACMLVKRLLRMYSDLSQHPQWIASQTNSDARHLCMEFSTNNTQPCPRPIIWQPFLRRLPAVRPRAINLSLSIPVLHPSSGSRRPPTFNLHRSRRPLPTPLPLPPLPILNPHPGHIFQTSQPHRRNLGRLLQRRLNSNPTRPRLRRSRSRSRKPAKLRLLPSSRRPQSLRLPFPGH